MQLCCIILTMVSCWFVEVHCTRPQNLTAKAVWKRTVSLSWKPAPFMGRYTNILCYRIWYAEAHDKKNEVNFTPFFFFFAHSKNEKYFKFLWWFLLATSDNICSPPMHFFLYPFLLPLETMVVPPNFFDLMTSCFSWPHFILLLLGA